MNKKMIVALTACTLMLTAMLRQAAFAADDVPDQYGIKVSADGAFTLGKTKFSKVIRNEDLYDGLRRRDHTSGSYEFDLKFSKEFKNDGEVVLSLLGGNESSLPVNFMEGAQCRELFYKQSYPNNKLNVYFGKLDLLETFARNNFADYAKRDQFSLFSRADPIIDFKLEGPALRLGCYYFEKFDIDCAHFTPDIANIDKEGFNILQATFKPSKDGNYRLYAWRYAWRLGSRSDELEEEDCSKPGQGRYGFGISADQAINRNFGLFLRSGCSCPYPCKDIQSPSQTMWNFGIQLKAPEWLTTGIVVGQLFSFSGYKDSVRTQHIEAYEKIALNDNFAIIPSFRYINNQGLSQKHRFDYKIKIAFHF